MEYRIIGKLIIGAVMKLETGLHIGGTEGSYEIGGQENTVIRDPLTERPMVPGSSLKGKLRSLLEWTETGSDNKTAVDRMIKKTKNDNSEGTKISAGPCNCGACDICKVFGSSADRASGSDMLPTRLMIRDSILSEEQQKKLEEKLGEGIMTEIKSENTLDRLTSDANPRTMERVPAGAEFQIDMVYDVYNDEDKSRAGLIFKSLSLLEDSALGGGGSRGSGRVRFEKIDIKWRPVDYYLKSQSEVTIAQQASLKELKDKWNQYSTNMK